MTTKGHRGELEGGTGVSYVFIVVVTQLFALSKLLEFYTKNGWRFTRVKLYLEGEEKIKQMSMHSMC